jgi:hypothetical protein
LLCVVAVLVATAVWLNGCTSSSNNAAPVSTGSISSTFSAAQPQLTPAASGSVTLAKHVLTMAALLGWNGSTVSPVLAAPYLSWAADPAQSKLAQIENAGIEAYVYTNGVIEYPCSGCSHLWSKLQANPQFIAKDCSGNILHNDSGEYVDVTRPAWYAYWSADVNDEYNMVKPAAWTAVFADDSDAPQFKDINPCGTTVASFTAGIASMLGSTAKPVIFSGLSVSAKQPEERSLYKVANVIGGMREDCYSGSGGFGHAGDFVMTNREHFYGAATDDWTQTENDQLYAATLHKLFICLSNATGPATAANGERTYVYASFMLTFDPGTSVLYERFAPSTSGGLTVYPESGLVPTNPVVSTPASIANLATGGVYAREFRECYYRGVEMGACAAVVNPTLGSQRFPFTQYRHTLAFSGGGVLEGGSVNFKGAAPPARLAGASALIAFP